MKTSNEPNRAVEAKLKELEEDREREKKRYGEAEQKLKEKIKTLEKLTKEKDVKLSQLHKALVQIKDDVVNEKEKFSNEKVDGNEDLIARMNKGTNPNDGRMEAMLQKAHETIKLMEKKNRDCQAEIKRLKEENRMGRTMQRR